MDPFIDQLNEKNLCTWYMLPLAGLNIYSFGRGNFVESYMVTVDDIPECFIAVQIRDFALCNDLNAHPRFFGVMQEEGHTLLILSLNSKWKPDYKLFSEGKYSKMSEEAKEEIRKWSTLKYQHKDSEKSVATTDAILMALDKNEALREKWLELIDVDAEHLPEEYLSLPHPDMFLKLRRK